MAWTPEPSYSPTRPAARLTLGIASALLALSLVAAVVAAPVEAEGDHPRHLRLEATSPAADTVITEPPAEIRLWFSEPPRMRGTAVRLADAGGKLVPTSEAAPDEDDPSQVLIRPRAPLPPGEYTVHWRVIARDGHAQNGTFGFELGSP